MSRARERRQRPLFREALERRQLLATLAVATTSELRSALRDAVDGDQVVMAPGVYAGSFYVEDLVGVEIRGRDANDPPIIDADGFQEALHLVNAERVTVDGLIIQNANINGINIDDGGDFSTPARDIVLRNLVVRDVGSDGNHDGIKLSGVVGFHLDGLTVTNWGMGGSAVDMVGSHDGLIENSHFENIASALGSGTRPKGGSSQITIRGNRFVNAGDRPIQAGGSTGLQYFRPQPPGSVEAADIVAEGNVIIGSRTGVSYANVDGDIDFHHNLIYRPSRWVMRILYENANDGFVPTQGGEFHDNVVIWNQGDLSTTVNVGPNTLPATFEFARNTWYNQTNPAASTPNLPAVELDGIVGEDPQIGVDDVIPWQFDWGTWYVNASSSPNEVTVEDWSGRALATPTDNDASFAPQSVEPLRGNWTLTPLTEASVTLLPYSQAILVTADAAPQVTAVDVNRLPTDPPDLPAGEQLTSWRQQRSDLHSLTVTFSEPVVVTPADVRLNNLGRNAPVDDDRAIVLREDQLELSGTQLHILLDDPLVNDGVYQLEIKQSVTDLSGNLLDGNADGIGGDVFVLTGNDSNGLYELRGDFNGDRGVSIFDFSTFSYWFGQATNVAPAYVDLNLDGGISIFDFPNFSSSFGGGVQFPTTLVTASTADRQTRAADRETTRSRSEIIDRLEEPLLERRRRIEKIIWSSWASPAKRPARD